MEISQKNGSPDSTLGIGKAASDHIIESARNSTRIKGLTHDFYRYPARFSPTFVRSVIETFTDPGDWVFDPFVGGGTTLVESMAMGRNTLGIDISSLSTFVCEAKTQILSDIDVKTFEDWKDQMHGIINMAKPSQRQNEYANGGYYRNFDSQTFWRLRKAIEQALSSIERLTSTRAKVLARCVVLRTAQWALDSRKSQPSIDEFRVQIEKHAENMLGGALEFRERISRLGLVKLPQALCLNRSTAGAEKEFLVRGTCPPRLIVTSPPYPGIHILYHRWQINGRRETPAPFWIAGKLDGAGSSYYTMGDRKNPSLQSYFNNLKAAFKSVAAMANENTTIVQMVAFSDAHWQLPKYLEIMRDCGLYELKPWYSIVDDTDGRLWRDVPSRRWHAQQKINSPGAREVVLVHNKVCN